jgi:hypothetical protein
VQGLSSDPVLPRKEKPLLENGSTRYSVYIHGLIALKTTSFHMKKVRLEEGK